MTQLFRWLAPVLILHRRWFVALVLALTAGALACLPCLEFDDNLRNLFESSASDSASVSPTEAPQSDLTCLLMIHGAPLVTAESLERIYSIHEELDALTAVRNIASMLDARQAKRVGRYLLPYFPGADAEPSRIEDAARRAHQHPMLMGQFLTADQTATLFMVELDESLDHRTQIERATNQIRQAVEKALEGSPLQYELTGLPILRVALAKTFMRDQWRFNIGGAIVAILVSAVAFRSHFATLIILLGPLLGVVWTMGVLALVGEPLSIVNGMVGPLTLTIGLTAAVHLMYHYQRETRQGRSPEAAAVSTIQVVGPACGWASLTTMIGFATLGASRLRSIQHFGFICAMAVALTVLAVSITFPLGCVFLRPQFLRRRSGLIDKIRSVAMERLLRVLDFVVMRPIIFCAMAVVVTVGLLFFGMRLEPAITISEALPSPSDSLGALQHVERQFGGVLPITTVIDWPAQTTTREIVEVVAAAHAVLEDQAVLSRPLSLVSLLRSLPGDGIGPQLRALRYVPPEIVDRFHSTHRRQSLLFARCSDIGTHRLQPTVENIEARLSGIADAHPGFALSLSEVIVDSVRVGNGMITDLANSLLFAVPLIALVLIVVFRSWRLSLASLIPNVFPLVATAACIVFLGWHLRLFTVSLFAIFFGIAVDDTIHLLLRFQNAISNGQPVRSAIRESIRTVGPAVVTTTIVLVAGMSVLLMSATFGIRCFGLLFCFGLVWALVGDLLLLPACLAVLFSSPDLEAHPSHKE